MRLEVWQGGHLLEYTVKCHPDNFMLLFAPFPVGYFALVVEAGGSFRGFESSPADGW